MAKRISDLKTANKSGNTSREYVLLSNIDSNSSTKLSLNDIFPTLQSGKATGTVATGVAGTTVQDIFVGGGVGSSIANADKSVLIFKGINVEDPNGALKIRTDVSNSDSNKKNIVIQLSQSSIDLSVASNTTSKFLSATGGSNVLTLSNTSHYTGNLPVTNGGTGASTLADGGILVGGGTGAIEVIPSFAAGSLLVGAGSGTNPVELTAGTNNYVLIADSSAPTGLKWGKPVVNTFSASANVNLNGNKIIMGTGFIGGSTTTTQGLRFSTSSDYVYIGNSTPFFTTSLNVEGGITVGTSSGTTGQTITQKACTAGATPDFTVAAANSNADLDGGNLVLSGGAGQSNGDGGNVVLQGGTEAGSGTAGNVLVKTGGVTAVTVDENQDVTLSAKLIVQDDEGITVKGTTTANQTTSLSNPVTLNSVAGIITLHATTVAAAAEYAFTLNNTNITNKSVILLTMESAAASTESDGATLIANVGGVPITGSCQIRITNPGSATSSAAARVHFLIINTAL